MTSDDTISVLMLGDIIGKPGRLAVTRFLQTLHPKPDLILANVENLAHGFGVNETNLKDLAELGIEIFTGGNHTFDRKEIFDFIDRYPNLLRPANYPKDTPGRGWCTVEIKSVKVAVLNLMGRVFMEPLQSPFLAADELLASISGDTSIILVDMHAEATSEKVAMGWYLNGRVSAVVGTHTHVQTADERILPGGTAYITDMGCCGPADGVIGMDRDSVFRRLIRQLPSRFEPASGPAMVNGVTITIDRSSGKARSISRVYFRETGQTDGG